MTNNVLSQPEKIELILTRAAEYFGRDKSAYTAENPPKARRKQSVGEEKKFICYLLKENTLLNLNEISKRLGYRSHVTVNNHYYNVKRELGDDVYGFEQTKRIHKELIKFIGL